MNLMLKSTRDEYRRKLKITNLIVRESPVLINSVDLRDLGANRFPLEYCLLLPLREQRYLVIHVFQQDVNSRLGG